MFLSIFFLFFVDHSWVIFTKPNCSLLKICSYINLQIPEKIPATQHRISSKYGGAKKKRLPMFQGEKKRRCFMDKNSAIPSMSQKTKKNMATFCNYQKKNTYQTETAFSAFSHLQPFAASRLEPTLKGVGGERSC